MASVGPQNGDIRATLALSQNEARSGTSRTLNLPGGRQITLNIPPGVQDGQEIWLPGQGEPSWNDGPNGDLVLTLAVAPTDPFGSQMYSSYGYGEDSPTEFIPPPPPPTPSSPNYPPTESGGSYTDYGDQKQEPVFLPQNQTPYADRLGAPYVAPMQPQPAVQGQFPQPPKRRRLGLTLLIILLALLLIVGGGLIYYATVYSPNQLHIQATATAQAQVTGTAQANAQATAQSLATAQAQANITATAQGQATAEVSATAGALQSIYTTATSGTPALNDPLTNQDSNNWDVFATNSSGGSCEFTGGAYHSVMTQKGFFQPCYDQTSNYSNFAFQVQMTITQGDEGGIIFRADPTNTQFYLLRINQDGSYDLFVYVDSSGSHAKNLLSSSTSLLKTGLNQPNLITVIARSNSLIFYINQQYLASVNDTTYSSGKIGVFGESYTNPTNVAFSNTQIWKL